jgi:hypothetical protein
MPRNSAQVKVASMLPPERRFGILLATVFIGLAVYAFLRDREPTYTGTLVVVGLFFAVLAVFAPCMLAPFSQVWMTLGEWMGKLVSPVVLGIIFFLLITPVAIIGRMCGRDELRLKRQDVNSFWIERVPPGPAPDSFRNQF